MARARGAPAKANRHQAYAVWAWRMTTYHRRQHRLRWAHHYHAAGAGAIQSGIGNLGTEAVIDVHRAAAEVLNVPWNAVDIVWGDTAKNFPYTCASGGSQTTTR